MEAKNNSSKLEEKFHRWRIRLYGGRGLDYHLWLKPAEDVFRYHHHDRCKCDVRAAADHLPDSLDPDCYDVVERMTCSVDFREAHRVVEGGFADANGDFDAKTSVVNCGDGDGFEVEAEASPYREMTGGHPAAKSKLIRFTVQGDNVQTRGPKWGNIGFTTLIPINLILLGKITAYLIEFVEFREVMACRYLLTRRPASELDHCIMRCDISDPRSNLYFDGTKLRTLKKAKTLTSERLLPLIHEILCDNSLFAVLDSACHLTHTVPLSTQVPRALADPCFDSDSRDMEQFMVSIYVTLLNNYNDLSLWIACNSDGKSAAEKPKAIHEILSLEAVELLRGYETRVTQDNAFNFSLLNEDLIYAAPKGKDGLHRNCIVVYQAIMARRKVLFKE